MVIILSMYNIFGNPLNNAIFDSLKEIETAAAAAMVGNLQTIKEDSCYLLIDLCMYTYIE